MIGPATHRGPRPLTTDAYPEHITAEDFALIGAALVGAACGMNALGHTSPVGLVEYVSPDALPTWHGRFVLDMVAYSQGFVQDELKNDALDRISGFMWQTGMMHHMADIVAADIAATSDADLDLTAVVR